MSLLAVRGLCKTFGGVDAARDVSFAVEGGEMIALIGPNGAGKSTVFNMIGGQLRPDGGRVLDGADITSMSAREPGSGAGSDARSRWRRPSRP